MTRTNALAVLAVLVWGVAGCAVFGGGGDEPKPAATTTVGGADPAPTASAAALPVGQAKPNGRKVLVVTQAGKLVSPERWPDACRLLDDEEIRAILPEAQKIDSRPYGVNTLGSTEPVPTNSRFVQAYASDGACRWAVTLTGDFAPRAVIGLRLRAVGDPELLRKQFEFWRHFHTQASTPSGVKGCYLEVLAHTTWVCQQGAVLFEVTGETTADWAEMKTSAQWENKVLPMVATTVAAKVKE